MNESSHDLSRIERKVDDLTTAVSKLVLFEERQTLQTTAIQDLTKRVTASEQKMDMWINRGLGAWALAGLLVALFKTFVHTA